MGSDITTSDKLKEIIATEHDRIKATWDKKNEFNSRMNELQF